MPDGAAPLPKQETQGLAPRSSHDGVVHLRRRSDWSGAARTEDEASWAAYRAALNVATATLTAYDGGTASHSDDVVTLCLVMAAELGVEARGRAYLLAAAELHDIGKIGIPPEILSKPAPLNDEEWELVRRHTVTGEEILGSVPELAEVARIVRHSHERWDGGGYPDGLAGERIPLASRIVFCADAFHAIRGDRPYRGGRCAREAMAEVEANSGTQFDPRVVDALAAAAEQTRGRRRGLPAMLVGPGRSQRLVALLAALAIGGGALAATGRWDPF
ncbi:MAG: HD-GYP domain-containing protein, partial [Chloroflexota bacterium]|nr:HD-GYP domain-containing protein [Chloroflexota bacterium]